MSHLKVTDKVICKALKDKPLFPSELITFLRASTGECLSCTTKAIQRSTDIGFISKSVSGVYSLTEKGVQYYGNEAGDNTNGGRA